MTLALAVLFGLVFGSFLNVCIYRVPRDLGVVAPRSFCPECGASIAATDNIPVLSFVLLRGRCRNCRKEIGWRYPIVEITTAAVFALVVYRYGVSLPALKWLVFESLLIVLFWTDFEERILPDEFTLGGLALAIGIACFVEVHSPLADLFLYDLAFWIRSLLKLVISALMLSVPIWVIGVLYAKLRKRDGLGFGDVKLLALLGAFLGLENGMLAMLIASLAGSALGIVLVLRKRRSALEYELPFGSFLCAGAALLPLVKSTS